MEQTTISTTSKRRQTTPLATDGTSIETLHRHNQVPRISELSKELIICLSRNLHAVSQEVKHVNTT